MNSLWWQNEKRQFVLWGIISLTLIVASLYSFRPVTSFQSAILTTVVPVLKVGTNISNFASDTKYNLASLWSIREDNKRLQIENQRLKRVSLITTQLQKENAELRRQLNFANTFKGKPIAARVLQDVSSPFNHSITVNVGTEEGVSRGHTAINGDGVVGRVVSTAANTSRILLLQDAALRIPVRFASSGINAIASGTGGKNLKVISFAGENRPKSGELAITSGRGKVFPAGLPVGTVTDAEGGATIAPTVNFNQLNIITILRSPVEGVVKK